MLRKNLNKVFEYFLYVLPAVLFFSYYPIISFGANETMNFELSLPLIWLVLFDLLVFVILIREKRLFKGLKKKWPWLLLPVYLTVSVFWSLSPVRGVLTVGILWLIYFAINGMYEFRELFDEGFRRKFLKWLFGSTLVICAWCLLQCILDLAGVGREYSLMCAGCTYKMFGFPHPNGFAIEPQFMGNLLLAPAIISGWIALKDDHNSNLRGRGSSLPSSRGSDPSYLDQRSPAGRRLKARSKLLACSTPTAVGRNLRKPLRILLLVVFSSTLFLTFSRGAIYAFVVAWIFLSVFVVVRKKKGERKEVGKKVGVVWGMMALAFLFTLNLQGVMAQVSPTDDTYWSGVTKVLNHLSLGKIDLRGGKADAEKTQALESEITEEKREEDDLGAVEKLVENSVDKEEAAFDGYVEESTNTRVRLTDLAVKVWSQDFRTVLFGVGLGGAGQALYLNNLSPAPKEIIQNEYASLLLETGLIGISLFILTMIFILKAVIKNKGAGLILTLIIAYGVTLMFFSGLPNALQIYLLPAVVLIVILKKHDKELL